eukprot:gene211-277_t
MQQASEHPRAEEGSGDLQDTIIYQAQDSISFDIAQNDFNLYGAGTIGHDETILTAENIAFNWETATIIATGKKNEQGFIDPKPAVQQDDQVTVRAKKAKMDVEETYYTDELKLTSCNLTTPHYYIKARHVKYVQGKRIASGPFQFYFDGVPTILGFFYGLLYLPTTKASGIIPPKPGDDSKKGFYLKEGGYYFYFNDYIDLILKGSIYSKGYVDFVARSNYKKRYSYSGHLEYERKVIPKLAEFGIVEDKAREWIFRWQHRTDHSKLSKLTANVSIEHRAGNYLARHQDDVDSKLKIATKSQVNYNRKIQGTPYSFNATLSHEENFVTKEIGMTLPRVTLSTTPIYFFRGKNPVTKHWYQDIYCKHTVEFQYNISNIIKNKPLEHSLENWMQFFKEGVYGARYHLPIEVNIKLFNYFNFKPFFEYTGRWYGQQAKYVLKNAQVTEEAEKGLYMVWDYGLGTNLQTTIYGTHIFSENAILRAIRHRIEPALGFSYRPGRPEYWQPIQASGKEVFKPKFLKPSYGTPAQKTSAKLEMKVDNVLEVKVQDREKGGATKKIPILESLSMKTSYDFLADSFPLGDFQLGGRTKLFDGLVSFEYTTTLDPYTYQGKNRLEEFAWQNGQGFGNVKDYNLAIGTSLKSKHTRKEESLTKKTKDPKQALENDQMASKDVKLDEPAVVVDRLQYVGGNMPWGVALMYRQRYTHHYAKAKKETTRLLEINGDFNVTKNWRIELRTTFDLDKEELVGEGTNVKIYRDLHCWQMSFDWYPLAKRQSFDFSIGLKASMLQDIKIPHISYGCSNRQQVGDIHSGRLYVGEKIMIILASIWRSSMVETLNYRVSAFFLIVCLCSGTSYDGTLDSSTVDQNVLTVTENDQVILTKETGRSVGQLHQGETNDNDEVCVDKQAVSGKSSWKYWVTVILNSSWIYWAVAILLFYVCYFIIRFIVHMVFTHLVERWFDSLTTRGKEIVDALYKSFSLLMIGLIMRVTIRDILPASPLNIWLKNTVLPFFQGVLLFIAMVFLYSAIDFIMLYWQEKAIKNQRNDTVTLLPMIKIILKIMITIVGAIYIVKGLGFDVKGLLAGLGIGGIGVALASQDTIKNLFGSFVILTDKPFTLGDYIVSENIAGTVEEIGFRSTRIQTDQNSMIYIPNGRLADMCVDNQGPKEYKQFSVKLAIPQSTSAARIEAFLEKLQEIADHIPGVQPDKQYVYLHHLEGATFYIKFDVMFHAVDDRSELASRQAILLKISQLAHALGISLGPCIFPNPIQGMKEVIIALPKMGESIMEATIIKWLKKEGDSLLEGESMLEVATDKVDSEIPALYKGVLKKVLVQVGQVVAIGSPIALMETEAVVVSQPLSDGISSAPSPVKNREDEVAGSMSKQFSIEGELSRWPLYDTTGRFYSPLVRNMAAHAVLSLAEMNQIPGTGKEGRVTKQDISAYILHKSAQNQSKQVREDVEAHLRPGDEMIPMDRVRKLIAQRMVEAVHTIPHVTSFVEADVTELVAWRERNKRAFQKATGVGLTYTPIFVQAVIHAIQQFPLINVSVVGDYIIKRKAINIGLAVALPNGNLIVPVVKHADQLTFQELADRIHALVNNARQGSLAPDDVTEGTYTISNIGSFQNLMGTPIIMQPQVAILAVGAIVKKPAVITTPQGDQVAIRHQMYLSHTYDHRVVDGALGGQFVKSVADYLEKFELDDFENEVH